MRFESLAVGQIAERTRQVTDADVMGFAAITGDHNPVHVDEAAAARSRFGGRIAHGMLGGGLISAAIANDLPGPGSIYLTQSLRFVRPIRPGDSVTTRIEIAELVPTKRRVRLLTTCRNQHGDVVIEGEATVLVPEDGA